MKVKHGDRRIGPGRQPAMEYHSWQCMKRRCNNLNDPRYSSYGGRGIKVCEHWNLYENFLADMGRRPSSQHSLDRIDNNGNYEPGNCRWATRSEQQTNKRLYKSNKTGINGVSPYKGRYRAVRCNNYLGTFDTIKEAGDAYDKAKQQT